MLAKKDDKNIEQFILVWNGKKLGKFFGALIGPAQKSGRVNDRIARSDGFAKGGWVQNVLGIPDVILDDGVIGGPELVHDGRADQASTPGHEHPQ